jgi:transposase
MIRIQLSPEEVDVLEHVFHTAADRKLRDRVQLILMAHRGRPHRSIAQDLGLTPRSVQRWLNVYRAHGLQGLHPRKAPGAPPKLPADLAPTIRQWVIEGPAAQGLDRANWTYTELVTHLYRTVASRSVSRRCRCSVSGTGSGRIVPRTVSCEAILPSKRRRGWTSAP